MKETLCEAIYNNDLGTVRSIVLEKIIDVAPGNRVIKRIKAESSLRKKQRAMKGLVL